MSIKKSENLLDKKPLVSDNFKWNKDSLGKITLEMENKGFFNTLAQKAFKKPRVSYIHLDDMGSFVWCLMDGKRTVEEIGVQVKAHFGEKANPLYERLARYIKILESYNMIH